MNNFLTLNDIEEMAGMRCDVASQLFGLFWEYAVVFDFEKVSISRLQEPCCAFPGDLPQLNLV